MASKVWNIVALTDSALAAVVVPTNNKEASILDIIIANYEASAACTVEVQLQDNAGGFKGYIIPPKTIAAKNAIYYSGKLLLAAHASTPDKIAVKSSKSGGGTNLVSILAFGDET